MKHILALDQGTTNSRAIVFDKRGRILGMAQQEFAQIYPYSGWVEHDPKDILGSQIGVVPEALIRAGVTIDEIEAIGITNQRETTFVWDKNTGKPVANAIVWQCRRTADFCEKLKTEGLSEFIYEKTGLVPDAYFSATKLKWILDNVAGARDRAQRGELLFGTVDTFLMWHLSRGEIFATDYTNASRTMLFNIHTLDWDDELLKLFGIPRRMLPSVHPSGFDYGVTFKSILGESVPILGVAGDQQAALFGQLCVESGSLKNTYGTGCFALANTGSVPIRSAHGLLTTLAAGTDKKPQFALEGSVFVGGAVVKWLRDELRMIKKAEETEIYARRVADTGGVYVVPAFVGLGAPYWDPDARGTVVGLSRGTTKEHFIRACLESIAFEVFDIIDAMEKDMGKRSELVAVDGGASANDFLMQFQSDLLNKKICRPQVTETTALGAAYLAGLTSGLWTDISDIERNAACGKIFQPDMDEETRNALLDGWRAAVRKARL